MSKVVILAVNSKYIHSTLAVWVLAQAVKEFAQIPHDISVIETNINQNDSDIVSQVAVHSPDVVGISTYIWNAHRLPDILAELRTALPNTVIVLGGPEASYNADFWYGCGADYVLSGEGERKFPALLDELSGAVAQEIPQGSVFVDPFTDEYLASLKGKIAYIETSRGCPYRCAYCLSGDSKLEHFPIDTVRVQIEKLASSDVRVIKFVDRTFNANANRACEIIEHIISLDSSNRFHFEVSADIFDDRTIELLSSASFGLFQIEAGLQSFFSPALKASNRHTNNDKAVKNLSKLLQAGNIHIHVDLIAGLPYETLEDFKYSFDKAYEIGAHKLQLGFLKMLHGSAMRQNEREIIFCENPPYEIISSPWISKDDLKQLKIAEGALQNTYNKGHFLSTLQYVLSTTKMRPFELYHALGIAVSNERQSLEQYAERIFTFFSTLPNISQTAMLDHMIFDWLQMVKGSNMPVFMKIATKKQLDEIRQAAQSILGRKIRRNEAAALSDGRGIFVDSENRNPTTKLYYIHSIT